eukprot:gnl/Chilomastix_cuspidata/5867.p1 GENE.gnl/Chilomastix_cuspidata/5867~~gnl/Chilomastix_cuspidata/5867.p1  ORF type:complete len:5101 (-),score=1901.11 gnl/Chilomastix_cuspidata/5867:11-15130(-)
MPSDELICSWLPPAKCSSTLITIIKYSSSISSSKTFLDNFLFFVSNKTITENVSYVMNELTFPTVICTHSFSTNVGLAAANALHAFNAALLMTKARGSDIELSVPSIIKQIHSVGFALARDSYAKAAPSQVHVTLWEERVYSFIENILQIWQAQISAFLKSNHAKSGPEEAAPRAHASKIKINPQDFISRFLFKRKGFASFPLPSFFAASASKLKRSKLDALYERLLKNVDTTRPAFGSESSVVNIFNLKLFDSGGFPEYAAPLASVAPLIPTDYTTHIDAQAVHDRCVHTLSSIKGKFAAFVPSIEKSYFRDLLKIPGSSFLQHHYAWTERANTLISIRDQLTSPEIRTVINVLDTKRSALLSHFTKLQRSLNEALHEAREICGLMGTLLPFLMRVHSAASKEIQRVQHQIAHSIRSRRIDAALTFPEAMSGRVFSTIFHIIGTAFTHTKRISSERISDLLEQFVSDLVFACQRFIGPDTAFFAMPELYFANINATLDILESFKSRFFYAKTQQFLETSSLFDDRSLLKIIGPFMARLQDVRTLIEFYIDFLPMSQNETSDFMSFFSRSVIEKIKELMPRGGRAPLSFALITIVNDEPFLAAAPTKLQEETYRQNALSFGFDKFLNEFINYFGEKERQITNYIFEEFLSVDISKELIADYVQAHRGSSLRFFFRWDLSLFFELFFSLKSLLNRKEIYSNVSSIVADVLGIYVTSTAKLATLTKKTLFTRQIKNYMCVLFPSMGSFMQKVKFLKLLLYRMSMPIRLVKALGFFLDMDVTKKAIAAHDKAFENLLSIQAQVVENAKSFFVAKIQEWMQNLQQLNSYRSEKPIALLKTEFGEKIELLQHLSNDLKHFYKENMFSQFVSFCYARFMFLSSMESSPDLSIMSQDEGLVGPDFVSFIDECAGGPVSVNSLIHSLMFHPNMEVVYTNPFEFFKSINLPSFSVDYSQPLTATSHIHPNFFSIFMNITPPKQVDSLVLLFSDNYFSQIIRKLQFAFSLMADVMSSELIFTATEELRTKLSGFFSFSEVYQRIDSFFIHKDSDKSEIELNVSQIQQTIKLFSDSVPFIRKLEMSFRFITRSIFQTEKLMAQWTQDLVVFRHDQSIDVLMEAAKTVVGDNEGSPLTVYDFSSEHFINKVRTIVENSVFEAASSSTAHQFNEIHSLPENISFSKFIKILEKQFVKRLKQTQHFSNTFLEQLQTVCDVLEIPPTSPSFLLYVDYLLRIFAKGCKQFVVTMLTFIFWCISPEYDPAFTINFLGSDEEFLFFDPALGSAKQTRVCFDNLAAPYPMPLFCYDTWNQNEQRNLHQSILQVIANYLNLMILPDITRRNILKHFRGDKAESTSELFKPPSSVAAQRSRVFIDLRQYFGDFCYSLPFLTENDEFIAKYLLHIVNVFEGTIEKAVESVFDFTKLTVNFPSPQTYPQRPEHMQLADRIDALKEDIQVLERFERVAFASTKFYELVKRIKQNNQRTNCGLFIVDPSSAVFQKQKETIEKIHRSLNPTLRLFEAIIGSMDECYKETTKQLETVLHLPKLKNVTYEDAKRMQQDGTFLSEIGISSDVMEQCYFHVMKLFNDTQNFPSPHLITVISMAITASSSSELYMLYLRLNRLITPLITFFNMAEIKFSPKKIQTLRGFAQYWKLQRPVIGQIEHIIPSYRDAINSWLNSFLMTLNQRLLDLFNRISNDKHMMIENDELLPSNREAIADLDLFTGLKESKQKYSAQLDEFKNVQLLLISFLNAFDIPFRSKSIDAIAFLLESLEFIVEKLQEEYELLGRFYKIRYVDISPDDFKDLWRVTKRSVVSVAEKLEFKASGSIFRTGESLRQIQNKMNVVYVFFTIRKYKDHPDEVFPLTIGEMKKRIFNSHIFKRFERLLNSMASYCDVLNLTRSFEFQHWFAVTNRISYMNRDPKILKLLITDDGKPKTKDSIDAKLIFALRLSNHLHLLYDIHMHIQHESKAKNEEIYVLHYWNAVSFQIMLPTQVEISDILTLSTIIYPELDVSSLYTSYGNCLMPTPLLTSSNFFLNSLKHGNMLNRSRSTINHHTLLLIKALQVWLWKYPMILNEFSFIVNFILRKTPLESEHKNIDNIFHILTFSNVLNKLQTSDDIGINRLGEDILIKESHYMPLLAINSGYNQEVINFKTHEFVASPGSGIFMVHTSFSEENDVDVHFTIPQIFSISLEALIRCRNVFIDNIQKTLRERFVQLHIPEIRFKSNAMLFYRMLSEPIRHPLDIAADFRTTHSVRETISTGSLGEYCDWSHNMPQPSVLEARLGDFSHILSRFRLASYYTPFLKIKNPTHLSSILSYSNVSSNLNSKLFQVLKGYIFSASGSVVAIDTIFGEAFPLLFPAPLNVSFPIRDIREAFDNYTSVALHHGVKALCSYALMAIKIIRRSFESGLYLKTPLCPRRGSSRIPLPISFLFGVNAKNFSKSPFQFSTHPAISLCLASVSVFCSFVMLRETDGAINVQKNYIDSLKLLKDLKQSFAHLAQQFIIVDGKTPLCVSFNPIGGHKLSVCTFTVNQMIKSVRRVIEAKTIPTTHEEFLKVFQYPYAILPLCDIEASALELAPNPDGSPTHSFGGLVCVGPGLRSAPVNPIFDVLYVDTEHMLSSIVHNFRSYSSFKNLFKKFKGEVVKNLTQLQDLYKQPTYANIATKMCEWVSNIVILKEVFGVAHKLTSVTNDTEAKKQALSDITGSKKIEEILTGTSQLTQNLQTFFLSVQVTQSMPSLTILKLAISEKEALLCNSTNIFSNSIPRSRTFSLAQLSRKGFYFLNSFNVMIPFEHLFELALKVFSIRLISPSEPTISAHPLFKTSPTSYSGVIHLIDNFLFIIQPSTLRTIPYKGALTFQSSEEHIIRDSRHNLLDSERASAAEKQEEAPSFTDAPSKTSDFSQDTDSNFTETRTEDIAWSSMSHTDDSVFDEDKKATKQNATELSAFSLKNVGVPTKVRQMIDTVERFFGANRNQNKLLENLVYRWSSFMMRIDLFSNAVSFLGVLGPRGFLPDLTFKIFTGIFSSFNLTLMKPSMRSFNFNYGTQILLNTGGGQEFAWSGLQEQIYRQRILKEKKLPPNEHRAERDVFITNHFILNRTDSRIAEMKFDLLYSNSQLSNPFIYDMIQPHYVHMIFSDSADLMRPVVSQPFPIIDVVTPEIEVLVLVMLNEWVIRPLKTKDRFYDIGTGSLFSLAHRSCRHFLFPHLLQPCTEALKILSKNLRNQDLVYVFGSQMLKLVMSFFDALIISVTPQLLRKTATHQINTVVVFCFFWTLSSFLSLKDQFVEVKKVDAEASGFQLKNAWDSVWDGFSDKPEEDDDSSDDITEEEEEGEDAFQFSIPRLETEGLTLGVGTQAAHDLFLVPFESLKHQILTGIKSSAPVNDSPLSWFPTFINQDDEFLVLKIDSWQTVTHTFFGFDEEEVPSNFLELIMPYLFLTLSFIHERNNLIIPTFESTPQIGTLFFDLLVRVFSVRHNKYIRSMFQSATVESAFQFSKELHLVYLALVIVPNATFPVFEPNTSHAKTVTFTSLNANTLMKPENITVSSSTPMALCDTLSSKTLAEDFMRTFEPTIQSHARDQGIAVCDPVFSNSMYHLLFFGETANSFIRKDSLSLFHDSRVQSMITMGQVPLCDGDYNPSISFTQLVSLPRELSNYAFIKDLLFLKGTLLPPFSVVLFGPLIEHEFAYLFESIDHPHFQPSAVTEIIIDVIKHINGASKKVKFSFSEFFSVVSYLQFYVTAQTSFDEFFLVLYHVLCLLLAAHPHLEAPVRSDLCESGIFKIFHKMFPNISAITPNFSNYMLFCKNQAPVQKTKNPYDDVLGDLGYSFQTVRSSTFNKEISGIQFIGQNVIPVCSTTSQIWSSVAKKSKHFVNMRPEILDRGEFEREWIFITESMRKNSLFTQHFAFSSCHSQLSLYSMLVVRLFTPIVTMKAFGPDDNQAFNKPHDPIMAPRGFVITTPHECPFIQILETACFTTTGYTPFTMSLSFPKEYSKGLALLASFILDVYSFVAWTGSVAVVYLPTPISTYEQYFHIFEALIKTGFCSTLLDIFNDEQRKRFQTFLLLSPLLSETPKTYIELPWLLLNSGILSNVRFIAHIYSDSEAVAAWERYSPEFWASSYVVGSNLTFSIDTSQDFINTQRNFLKYFAEKKANTTRSTVSTELMDSMFVTIPYGDDVRTSDAKAAKRTQTANPLELMNSLAHILAESDSTRAVLSREDTELILDSVFPSYVVMAVTTVFLETSKLLNFHNLVEAHLLLFKVIVERALRSLAQIEKYKCVNEKLKTMFKEAGRLRHEYETARTNLLNSRDVLDRMFVGICHSTIQLEKQLSAFQANSRQLTEIEAKNVTIEKEKSHLNSKTVEFVKILEAFGEQTTIRELEEVLADGERAPKSMFVLFKLILCTVMHRSPENSVVIARLRTLSKTPKRIFNSLIIQLEQMVKKMSEDVRMIAKQFTVLAQRAFETVVAAAAETEHDTLLDLFDDEQHLFVGVSELKDFPLDLPVDAAMLGPIADLGLTVNHIYRPIFTEIMGSLRTNKTLVLSALILVHQVHMSRDHFQVDMRIDSLRRNAHQLEEQNKSLERVIEETQRRIREDKASHFKIETQCEEDELRLTNLKTRVDESEKIKKNIDALQQQVEFILGLSLDSLATITNDSLLFLLIHTFIPRKPPGKRPELIKALVEIMSLTGLTVTANLAELLARDTIVPQEKRDVILFLDHTSIASVEFLILLLHLGGDEVMRINSLAVGTLRTMSHDLLRTLMLMYAFPYTCVLTVGDEALLDDDSVAAQVRFLTNVTAQRSDKTIVAVNDFTQTGFPREFAPVDVRDGGIAPGLLFERIVRSARQKELELLDSLSTHPSATKFLDGTIQFSVPSPRMATHFVLPVVVRLWEPLECVDALEPFLSGQHACDRCAQVRAMCGGRYIVESEERYLYTHMLPEFQSAREEFICPIALTVVATAAAAERMARLPLVDFFALPIPLAPIANTMSLEELALFDNFSKKFAFQNELLRLINTSDPVALMKRAEFLAKLEAWNSPAPEASAQSSADEDAPSE